MLPVQKGQVEPVESIRMMYDSAILRCLSRSLCRACVMLASRWAMAASSHGAWSAFRASAVGVAAAIEITIRPSAKNARASIGGRPFEAS